MTEGATLGQLSDEELQMYVAPVLGEEALKNREELLRKAEELRPLAQRLVDALQKVSGLDDFSAKTCAYYCIATHGLKTLSNFPILVLQGPPGTGKSAAMKAMRHFAHDPVPMSTTPTKAVLRDKLGDTTTAFIEEGDCVDEEIIRNRYSREAAVADVNRPRLDGRGFYITPVQFFGATVLHRRLGFQDLATVSRSIVIKTKQKPGSYMLVNDIKDYLAQLGQSAMKVWEGCSTGIMRSGRPEDVWWPLAIVAANILDVGWLRQWRIEVAKHANGLRFGASFEPDQAIICALMALDHGKLIQLSDIRDHLRKEYDWQPTTYQVGAAIRNLGFEVKTSHGQRKVNVDRKLLVELARQLGIDDESFNGDDEPPNGLVISVRGLQR